MKMQRNELCHAGDSCFSKSLNGFISSALLFEHYVD
jgi:hypothetical protein